jgi:hypothetical protein
MKLITLTKYGFPVAIIIALILAFSSNNNFTSKYDNQIDLMSTDTISRVEIFEFVNAELIEPFKKERIKSLPLNEQNCVEHEFKIDYNYPEDEILPIYKNEMIGGTTQETNCNGTFHLNSVKVFFDKKEILVRNSQLEKWESAEVYINNYKKENYEN